MPTGILAGQMNNAKPYAMQQDRSRKLRLKRKVAEEGDTLPGPAPTKRAASIHQQFKPLGEQTRLQLCALLFKGGHPKEVPPPLPPSKLVEELTSEVEPQGKLQDRKYMWTPLPSPNMQLLTRKPPTPLSLEQLCREIHPAPSMPQVPDVGTSSVLRHQTTDGNAVLMFAQYSESVLKQRHDNLGSKSTSTDTVRSKSISTDTVRSKSVSTGTIGSKSIVLPSTSAVQSKSVSIDTVRSKSTSTGTVGSKSIVLPSTSAVWSKYTSTDAVRSKSISTDAVRNKSISTDAVRSKSTSTDAVRSKSVVLPSTDTVRSKSISTGTIGSKSIVLPSTDAVRSKYTSTDAVRSKSVVLPSTDTVRGKSVVLPSTDTVRGKSVVLPSTDTVRGKSVVLPSTDTVRGKSVVLPSTDTVRGKSVVLPSTDTVRGKSVVLPSTDTVRGKSIVLPSTDTVRGKSISTAGTIGSKSIVLPSTDAESTVVSSADMNGSPEIIECGSDQDLFEDNEFDELCQDLDLEIFSSPSDSEELPAVNWGGQSALLSRKHIVAATDTRMKNSVEVRNTPKSLQRRGVTEWNTANTTECLNIPLPIAREQESSGHTRMQKSGNGGGPRNERPVLELPKNCPMCNMKFHSWSTQIDVDSHLASCLAGDLYSDDDVIVLD